MELEVPIFEGEASRDLYHSEFLENNELWIPYVKAVCQKHSLPINKIKGKDSHFPLKPAACLKPGTFPVLIVDKNYAVKLYTKYREFLDGEEVYQVRVGVLPRVLIFKRENSKPMLCYLRPRPIWLKNSQLSVGVRETNN